MDDLSGRILFYEELNDFLPTRQREFTCDCVRAASTKYMIEVLSVPRIGADLILVGGESADFDRL